MRVRLIGDKIMYKLAINITNDCNMACKYCPSSDKSNKAPINKDELIKFIELASKTYDLEEVYISGGEPLLVLDYMKFIIDYIIGINTIKYNENVVKTRRIQFNISTNGILLPNNFNCIKYILDNPSIRLFISTDGTRLSNSLRINPTGKNKLVEAKKIADVIPADLLFQLVAQMTVSELTIPFFNENISYIYNQGYRMIYLNAIDNLQENERIYKEIENLHNDLFNNRYPGLVILNSLGEIYQSYMSYSVDNNCIGIIYSTDKNMFPPTKKIAKNKTIIQDEISNLYYDKLFRMVQKE